MKLKVDTKNLIREEEVSQDAKQKAENAKLQLKLGLETLDKQY